MPRSFTHKWTWAVYEKCPIEIPPHKWTSGIVLKSDIPRFDKGTCLLEIVNELNSKGWSVKPKNEGYVYNAFTIVRYEYQIIISKGGLSPIEKEAVIFLYPQCNHKNETKEEKKNNNNNSNNEK